MAILLNPRASTEIVSRLVDISTRLPSNLAQDRIGGVLTIGSFSRVGVVEHLHSIDIGEVADNDKSGLYLRFSREKAYRLLADWLRDPSSISSWQTRDPEINRYGGSVLFPANEQDPLNPGLHQLVSFSGLKEHVDEAVSLTLGYDARLADDDYVRKVIEISENPVFYEMLEAWQRN